jgi:hypothetical protein
VLILLIAVINLSLTLSANRPDLVSVQATLYANSATNPPEFVRINWNNIGKRSAHRGVAILYSLADDGARFEKFGVASIGSTALNQSTPVPPITGYGGAMIRVEMNKFLGLFLACVTYYDDSNNQYQQRFTYSLGERALDNSTTWLNEVPPNAKIRCQRD